MFGIAKSGVLQTDTGENRMLSALHSHWNKCCSTEMRACCGYCLLVLGLWRKRDHVHLWAQYKKVGNLVWLVKLCKRSFPLDLL